MLTSRYEKKDAIRQAVGPLIFVDRDTFLDIIQRDNGVLVVVAEPTMLTKTYQYMCSHKGMTFVVQGKEKFDLPAGINVLRVKFIQIPFSPIAEKESLIWIIILFIAIIGIGLLISYFNAG